MLAWYSSCPSWSMGPRHCRFVPLSHLRGTVLAHRGPQDHATVVLYHQVTSVVQFSHLVVRRTTALSFYTTAAPVWYIICPPWSAGPRHCHFMPIRRLRGTVHTPRGPRDHAENLPAWTYRKHAILNSIISGSKGCTLLSKVQIRFPFSTENPA